MTAPSTISMRERLQRDYRWTARQREVLALIAHGKTNTQIGNELGISLDGAKWHVSEILTKLDAESRDEAAEYWRRYNGLTPRFERIFRGLTGAVTTKWVAGSAAVLIAGAATAAIIGFAMKESTDEPRTGPDATLDPSTPPTAASTPPGATTFTDEWLWQAPRPKGRIWLRADTGKVVASYGDETADAPPALGGGVALLNAETGAEFWQFDSEAHAFPAAITPQHIVFGTADGTVFGLDLTTGQEVWRLEFPGIPFQAVGTGSVVVIADADPGTFAPRIDEGFADRSRLGGLVWAVDPATGEVKWTERIGTSSAYTAYGNGAIIVASDSPRSDGVVALDPSSGNRLWEAPSDGASSPPVVWDAQALVAGARLTALDLRTGTENWAVRPDGDRIFGYPAGHGGLLAVGTSDGTIEVRSLADGGLRQNADTGDCTVRPFSFGHQLFVLACGGLGQLLPGTGETALATFFIPQGSIDSLATTGNFLVLSTGTGHTPDRTMAIRPAP